MTEVYTEISFVGAYIVRTGLWNLSMSIIVHSGYEGIEQLPVLPAPTLWNLNRKVSMFGLSSSHLTLNLYKP